MNLHLRIITGWLLPIAGLSWIVLDNGWQPLLLGLAALVALPVLRYGMNPQLPLLRFAHWFPNSAIVSSQFFLLFFIIKSPRLEARVVGLVMLCLPFAYYTFRDLKFYRSKA